MKRIVVLAGLLVVVVMVVLVGGGALGSFTSAEVGVGGALPGLTADEHQRFLAGQLVFQREFVPPAEPSGKGLGPLFNSTSCAECHESPVVGGSGAQEQGGDDVEVHATRFTADGKCDELTGSGGPVFQQHAVTGAQVEMIPANARISRRITPPVWGLGLLEAIPDATLEGLQARTGGRVHRLPDGRIGRFGRKAEFATLVDFTTAAFREEQGIDVAAEEVTPEERDLTADFVRFLAPPEPLPLNLEGQIGAFYFRQIGCATCHVPVLETGPSPVAALNQRRVVMWSDLLLHDMGPALADSCLGDAGPQEFRTEPLAGLRFRKQFLHDGRALTLESAIVQHGGRAQASTENWSRLPGFLREAVLTFLRSL
jgi:CxxC motif-containing protein (DUF1111 family)